MPFDFAAEPNIGRERLRTLATMLRDPEVMGVWRWDYGNFSSCALGLASKVFGVPCPIHYTEAMDIFQIDRRTAKAIFADEWLGAQGDGEFDSYGAEPGDVAERIEAYLNESRQAELVLA